MRLAKFLRTLFFIEYLWWLFLYIIWMTVPLELHLLQEEMYIAQIQFSVGHFRYYFDQKQCLNDNCKTRKRICILVFTSGYQLLIDYIVKSIFYCGYIKSFSGYLNFYLLSQCFLLNLDSNFVFDLSKCQAFLD